VRDDHGFQGCGVNRRVRLRAADKRARSGIQIQAMPAKREKHAAGRAKLARHDPARPGGPEKLDVVVV
jgi:hypothetical protein